MFHNVFFHIDQNKKKEKEKKTLALDPTLEEDSIEKTSLTFSPLTIINIYKHKP